MRRTRQTVSVSHAVRAVALAGLALASATAPVSAAESYDNCTGFIDAIPATISTQGTWCLRQDVSMSLTSGSAISIATSNVTIDCNGYKLGNLGAGPGTQSIGIHAVNRFNATVRGCNVRGFIRGIYLIGTNPSSTGGHLAEDNRLDNVTRTALRVDGDGSIVRRNLVRDTGGSTTTTGSAWAINTVGDVDLIDNTVVGVLPSADGVGNGSAYGLRVELNNGGSVERNRVRGTVGLGAGGAYGILMTGSDYVSARDNHVVGPGTAALSCAGSTSGAKDNTLYGFSTGLVSCTDDGGNTVK